MCKIKKRKINIEEIKEGIAVYRHEQSLILRWLRKRKSINQDEFDYFFTLRSNKKPLVLFPISGKNYLLGFGEDGISTNDWWLELMQYMIILDLVDVKKDNGKIVYTLGTKAFAKGAAGV